VPLRVIVDEVEESFHHGFSVYDALIQEWRTARLAIVAILADTKGLAPFHDGSQFPSELGCHLCHARGISMKRKGNNLSTIYPIGSSKLREDHPLRSSVDAASVYHALDKPLLKINTSLRTKAEAIKYGREAEQSAFPPSNSKHPRFKHFYHKVHTLTHTHYAHFSTLLLPY
jgi:hypothetical protein